jgi:uncharacterized membrane protein (DUF485 family)
VDKAMVEKIKQNPSYNELVSKRSSFAWKLAIAMLVVYYAFIMTIAFNPSALGASLSGGITTVGIPVGMAIIVFAFVLTGIYVKRANGEFDELTQKIKDDIKKENR